MENEENKNIQTEGSRHLVEPIEPVKPKKKKTLVIILVLSVLVLLGVVAYVGYNQYIDYQQQNNIDIFNIAVEQIANALFDEAIKCQPIPLGINGKEINLIALECLEGTG